MKAFNIASTNACKGFALLLLLWHHLFYQSPDYGYITFKIATFSKVCVAIFVILSGYGFSESIRGNNINLFQFYKKRLSGLYFNYWFIALIFVPIGVFLMGRPIHEAFVDQPYLKFLIQMLGVHKFFYTEDGYNLTWWYMSVIIPFIILFPFIYKLIQKYGVVILLPCFLILLPQKDLIPTLTPWILPFVLGIYFSQQNHFVSLSEHWAKYGRWRWAIILLATGFVAVLRGRIPFLSSLEMDGLFGLVLISLIFEIIQAYSFIKLILIFLGKHLFNIFIFHTFIYKYYLSDFIYSFQNPLVIFIVLLSICLLISIILEEIKKRIYFYRLIDFIKGLPIPSKADITLKT